MAAASLVIGIIFLAAVWTTVSRLVGIPSLPLGILGSYEFALPASIVGLILGILAVRKKSKRAIATAGIVLNAIILLSLVALITMWAIMGD